MDGIIKEAVETELHSNIMNWKDGLYVGKSCKSLILLPGRTYKISLVGFS
jgi:hypothetical protein